MAAAPWYLLAGGIVLVILGYFIAGFGRRRSDRVFITAKMSDEEVERQLNKESGSPIAGLVMGAGFLIILISIVWRIVRIFVKQAG
jgi:hypothetical protein